MRRLLMVQNIAEVPAIDVLAACLALIEVSELIRRVRCDDAAIV